MGAVHDHQTEYSGVAVGSSASLVATKVDPVTLRFVPVRTVLSAKLSFAGAARRSLPPKPRDRIAPSQRAFAPMAGRVEFIEEAFTPKLISWHKPGNAKTPLEISTSGNFSRLGSAHSHRELLTRQERYQIAACGASLE